MSRFSAGEYTLSNLSDFNKWVDQFCCQLQGTELILLSGDLGAGKTEFAKRVASYFEIQNVASPTFSLHQHYTNSRIKIDHFDLYRLDNLDELESIGFWDIISEPSLALIEWPERVPDSYWPQERVRIHIKILKSQKNETERVIFLC